MAGALALGSCATQEPTSPRLSAPSLTVNGGFPTGAGWFILCKVGPEATFDVRVPADTAAENPAIFVFGDDCIIVYSPFASEAEPLDPSSRAVTVTEIIVPAGTQLDSIVRDSLIGPHLGTDSVRVEFLTGINSATGVVTETSGGRVTFYNSPCAGRIGDFVWLDLDGDGVQDGGEPGIKDVKVVLQDGSGNPLATATTDGSGAYLFPGLCYGNYRVLVDESTIPAGLTRTQTGQGPRNGQQRPAGGGHVDGAGQ